ncbi:MAG: hypothetical protein KAH23_01940 [Kiritimatiellae bacterium]|nr:hypothetical protein [Kiritimatiellia bacterium]
MITDVPSEDDEVVVLSECAHFAQLFGLIINNTANSYWFSDSDTKNATNECFEGLVSAFAVSGDKIEIDVIGESLTMNDEVVDIDDHLIGVFAQHLRSLDIASFVVMKGIDSAEFEKLVEVLSARPDEMVQLGGFSNVLKQFNMAHVHAISVKYERVSDDDAVVAKNKLQDGKSKLSKEDVAEKVAAIFKDKGLSDDDAVKLMAEAAADPARMADLICEASATGEKDGVKEGAVDEKAGEKMLDNLQKTFDMLMQGPSARTQKGKKDIAKMLGNIEKEMLKKLKGPDAKEQAKAVSEAVDLMRDELKMEALAAEYMKKRKAIADSEERILRYIKAKGLDQVADTELEGKLAESGLDAGGWGELVQKSGATDVPGMGGGLPVAGGVPGSGVAGSGVAGAVGAGTGAGGDGFSHLSIGHLATLLDHLEDQISKVEGDDGGQTPEEVASALTEVNNEINGMMVGTQKKITDFVGEIMAEQEESTEGEQGDVAKKKSTTMTKRRMLQVLAEIVQELFQPLSVVNCTLDMIVSKALGDVADTQIDMLKLARESTEKIQMLIDALNKISGVPDSESPDAEMIKTFYDGT